MHMFYLHTLSCTWNCSAMELYSIKKHKTFGLIGLRSMTTLLKMHVCTCSAPVSSCFNVFFCQPCHGCPLLVVLEDRLFVSSLSAWGFQVLGNIQRCRWVCESEKPSSVECTFTLELMSTYNPSPHVSSAATPTMSWHLYHYYVL